MPEAVGNSQGPDAGACKRFPVNIVDGAGKGEFVQGAAAVKHTVADLRHALRQSHLGEIAAAGKNKVVDFRVGILEFNLRQIGAVAERI